MRWANADGHLYAYHRDWFKLSPRKKAAARSRRLPHEAFKHEPFNHEPRHEDVRALLAAVFFAGPAIPYFKYQRPLQAAPGGQRYVAVDEAIWKNARLDLGDLRLYSGQQEVPYALTEERGSRENDTKDVRVLQQSVVGGKTQFVIDMADVAEYDHIALKLAAKNFVAHARVEGQEDLHGTQWALLAEPILYDLSKENLGGNSMLRLPLSTYKYLRVTIDGPVKPDDVLGATSEFRQEQKAVWRDVGGAPTVAEMPMSAASNDSSRRNGKATVLTFAVPEKVPLDRVTLEIDPSQPNFRRSVQITIIKMTTWVRRDRPGTHGAVRAED